MPNLLELNSLDRYRLFLGLGGGLLFAVTLARILAGGDDSGTTRVIAATSMTAFALFAHKISFVTRNHHAFAVICLLPMTLHMAAMTYWSSLSYDLAISNMVILSLICLSIDDRRWLNIQVTIWCACVISVAWVIENPIMSPLTYSILVVVLAVFIGMLVVNFYEAQDLLARKIAELEESQSFANVGTWEVDLKTMQPTWSKTTREIMQMNNPSDPLTFHNLLADTSANEDFSTQIRRFFEGEDSFDAVGQIATAKGEHIWVRSRGTTFYEKGIPVRKFGVFLDISDHMEREQALEEARKEAESAAAARTQFLANMSHEIRTPMNGVIGMTSLLEQEELSDTAAKHVSVIQSCSEALLTTINDILDFTKLDAGKLELEKQPFILNDVIDSSVQIVQQAIEEQGLELVRSGSVPQAHLVGDPLRLKQVLVNLLSNATKFTEQGSISIHAHVLNESDTDCHFQLSVIDTGIGIDKAAQTKLFSPFVQADTSTTRKYGGTGLGLAICHKIVSQMGGEIRLESTPDEGAKFTINLTLPITEHAVQEHQAVDLNLSENLKVLIAEDNKVNQTVATKMLKKLGIEATVVSNGRLAVEQVSRSDFDLVLMDVQMPVMDGIEATSMIREQADVQQPKIIALTANALVEDRERCLAAGMDDFITKPIRLEDLRTAIARNHC